MVHKFILLAIFVGTVLGQKCSNDSECRKNECCIEYFPYYKRCRDMPDDPGDRCLGQFLCNCQNGMRCEPDPPSVYNYIKLGAGHCRQ